MVSIAAIWIQKNNRSNANILKFMPTGWTNGRLPKQSITFLLNNEEHLVRYFFKDGIFKFDSGKHVRIHEEDAFGLDVEFDNLRHYARISMSESELLVHMPYGLSLIHISEPTRPY